MQIQIKRHFQNHPIQKILTNKDQISDKCLNQASIQTKLFSFIIFYLKIQKWGIYIYLDFISSNSWQCTKLYVENNWQSKIIFNLKF